MTYKSKKIYIGELSMGGGAPVRVQTMTNTDTLDIKATLAQILNCQKKGAELIRLSVQTPKHAKAFGRIKKSLLLKNNNIPLVADIHYLPSAAWAVLPWADKIRLNPGNFVKSQKKSDIKKALQPFLEECKKKNIILRVGANTGSLPDHIKKKYGHNHEALVESAMEYVNIISGLGFEDLLVAVKASSALTTINANVALAERFIKDKYNFPIHLGVTESGIGQAAIIKSSVAIGSILSLGIGDTIRVSLSGKPENEISVAYDILQALGLRQTKLDIVSCPSCGRTTIDVEQITKELAKKVKNNTIKIAVMGCVVNGLGEAENSDIAVVGIGKGVGDVYKDGRVVYKNVEEKEIINKILQIV